MPRRWTQSSTAQSSRLYPLQSGEDEDKDRDQEQAMTGFGSHAVVSRKARCKPVAKNLKWKSGA